MPVFSQARQTLLTRKPANHAPCACQSCTMRPPTMHHAPAESRPLLTIEYRQRKHAGLPLSPTQNAARWHDRPARGPGTSSHPKSHAHLLWEVMSAGSQASIGRHGASLQQPFQNIVRPTEPSGPIRWESKQPPCRTCRCTIAVQFPRSTETARP